MIHRTDLAKPPLQPSTPGVEGWYTDHDLAVRLKFDLKIRMAIETITREIH